MIFDVTKASDHKFKKMVEISTVEDLLQFIKENYDKNYAPQAVIYPTPDNETGRPEIMIYDDWIE